MAVLRKTRTNKNAVATCEGQPPRQRFSSTLALSGTQQAPRSGNLLLRVRDEQPVSPHFCPKSFSICSAVAGFIG